MVGSFSSKRPHYVYVEKSGKVTWENCAGWASSNLCKHTVAVGEKLEKPAEYLDWLRHRHKPMNWTTMVTFDSNKGLGQKGNKASTSRQKGGQRTKVPT